MIDSPSNLDGQVNNLLAATAVANQRALENAVSGFEAFLIAHGFVDHVAPPLTP